MRSPHLSGFIACSLMAMSCIQDHPEPAISPIIFGIASDPVTRNGSEEMSLDTCFIVSYEPFSEIISDDMTRSVPEVSETGMTGFHVSTVKGDAEEAVCINTLFSRNSDGLYYPDQNMYWPGTDEGYRFFASNIEMHSNEGDYSKVNCPEGTDVVCAYISDPAHKQINTLNFSHIFARIGSVSIKGPDGFNVTSYSCTVSCPLSGVYDMASSLWTEKGDSKNLSLNKSNDHWVVPGTYRVNLTYSISNGSITLTDISKAADVTFVANRISNLTVHTGNVYSNELVITPSSQSIKYKESTGFKAIWHTITNGIKDSGTDVTSLATWTTSSPGTASVSNGTATGKGPGTAIITASYGGKNASAALTVNNAYSYRLELTPVGGSIYVGETLKLTARYYTTTNDVEDSGVDVSAAAAWEEPSNGTATVRNGIVTGIKSGSAYIVVRYGGKAVSSVISVKDRISYELVVSPPSTELNIGESTSLKATYYCITNGVRDAGSDVTSGARWSSSDSSVATVEGCSVTGKSSGTTTVSASYRGLTSSSQITVIQNSSIGVEPGWDGEDNMHLN